MDHDEDREPIGGWQPVEDALRAAFRSELESEGVRRSIERRHGVDSMLVLREPGRRSRIPAPRAAAALDRRYDVEEELGRGGVGVVLRGRDRDLGREVALKFLREEHADKGFVVERFLQEAQIEGQLQHPGIVPVYELGVSPDGRPFFAMKLVRGQTLAALLEERESPADDRTRLISVFEQICHAVAYAHARGVVHRDLKPDNVMVGAFGEVQIVDWGFAKVLGAGTEPSPPITNEDEVRTVASGSSSAATQVGSMLGTPPYMPPEQARGGKEGIDERADVFSLGAILLEILTGAPAYHGDGHEVLQKALSADLADAYARLDACVADAELVSLCRACLQPPVSDRPRNAGEVRERLTRHLTATEERARQAELAAAEARIRAQGERRARRLTVGLAAAILLATLLGGGGYLWVVGERRARTAHASRIATDALTEARELLATARGAPVESLASWDAALAAARTASEIASGGAPTTDVEATARLLALVDRERKAAAERKRRWERDEATKAHLADIRTRRGEDQDLRDTNLAYAEVFREHGLDVEAGAVDAARLRDSAIAPEFLAALDEWTWIRRRLAGSNDPVAQRMHALASAADPDPERVAIREAAYAADGAALCALVPVAQAPDAALLLGRHLALAGEEESGAAVLESTWRRQSSDFWVSFELAEALSRLDRPAVEDAIGYYRAALASSPASKGARRRLAAALRRVGRLDDALDIWRTELALDANDLTPYRHLVELHEERGDLEEAIAGLEAEAATAGSDPRPYVGLGLAFSLRREWDAAVRYFRQAEAAAPDDPAIRLNLSESLLWAGQEDLALETVDAAIALDEANAAAWEVRHRITAVRGDTGDSIACARKAAELEPEKPLYQFALAAGLHSTREYEEAQAVGERFVALAPFEPHSHSILGLVLIERGALERGIAEIEHAIRLVKDGLEAAPWGITEIVVYDPDTQTRHSEWVPGWDPNMGPMRFRLAQAKIRLGDMQGALDVLDVLPWRPEFRIGANWIRYGIFLMTGRPLDALPLLEDIVEDRVAGPAIHYNLAMCLLAAERYEEARAELHAYYEACRWPSGWQYPEGAWREDVDILVRLGSHLPQVSEPLELARTPRERVLLALILQAHGRHLAAAKAFRAAFAESPDLATEFAPWPRTYPLACLAAQEAILAGHGLGSDAADLDGPARAGLRDEALAFMRLALGALRDAAADEPAHGSAWIRRAASEWSHLSEFAFVQEEANLRKLPAVEAQAWRAFWTDVESASEAAAVR